MNAQGRIWICSITIKYMYDNYLTSDGTNSAYRVFVCDIKLHCRIAMCSTQHKEKEFLSMKDTNASNSMDEY